MVYQIINKILKAKIYKMGQIVKQMVDEANGKEGFQASWIA